MSEKLVEYLHALCFEDLPKEVIEKAKLCILDTLGVALAGSQTMVGKVAREFAIGIGGPEDSTLYNCGAKISCVLAAYANGTMSFCHNFTDTMLSCVVHCGPVVVPSSLAVSEKEKNVGKDILLAIVAGYEMMTRVANVINSGSARMSHHNRGFHATGTTGVFGACLAASKLLGLSLGQTYDALGIAGSYASGILESITSPETEVWRSHPGIASQNGITAALLASSGLRGPVSVFRGRNGFFKTFGGKQIDLDKFEAALGDRFAIMDSAFKLHNSAHIWAGPLDCLKTLARDNSIAPENVSKIEVKIPTMYSYVMEQSEAHKYPTSYAESQNNPCYAMAAVLLYGGLYLEEFSESVLRDPRMKQLFEKVSIGIDPSLNGIFRSTDKMPSQVSILLDNEKELTMTVDYPKGSPQNPAGKDEIQGKFIALAGTVMEKDRAKKIGLIIADLERMTKLHRLFEYLGNP